MGTADRWRTGALIAVLACAAAAPAAAAPVSGSVFGEIVGVTGATFTVKTTQVPGGKAVVSVGSARMSEQKPGMRADLRKGVCVTANGQRAANGTVTARRVALSTPVKGKCTGGFGGVRPGRGTRERPRGAQQRLPAGKRRPGDVGFAVGAITSVEGSTITVHGPHGTIRVTLTKTIRISKTVEVGRSAIRARECVFVLGASADKGRTVKAREISLTPATSSGCNRGFGRRPGG